MHGYFLPKEPLAIEQPHSYHIISLIAGLLQVVTRENAETTGVYFEIGIKSILHT